jgi:His-Xaa-Ser system protein HxsD
VAEFARDLVVVFGREAATMDAIQRAGYRLADRFAVDVIDDEDGFRCRLLPAPGSTSSEEELVYAFRTEVLDQVLRARIRDETREERNLILALAFSNSDLVGPA